MASGSLALSTVALKPELAADSQACQAQVQPSPSSFSNGVKFAPSLRLQLGSQCRGGHNIRQTLYQSCSTVANQYSTCNGCADAASSQVVTAFKSSIEVSFQTWQQILTVGQQRYASVWKSQSWGDASERLLTTLYTLPLAVFQQFSTWVTAAKTACSSLNLQLDVILKGLNLNLNLFLGININLSGLLGGILGGLGSLVGGLLGRREIELLE
ncbi:hypothetical protein PSHT_06151 [Puccinia striiformis]|uniref:Uncharacterized protein n=1 Tax=Puccinia striiformis TaxID=27350 RepID=A0A2S4W8P9_9BASI|nr:hypothetical protein PSHT_06151 [Puccinia striiformis]